jgi:hypothetical protein
MFKANVIGLDAYRKAIETAKKEVQANVANEIRASAMEFEQLAKRNAANNGGDQGGLQKSIGHRQIDAFNYEVFAGISYAPFIEFGTKKKVKVEPGFEDVAAQFRGQKGTGTLTLLQAIKAWVKRKGIAKGKAADQAAFNIARSIYRNGISPKPFFYKNVAPVRTNLLTRIKAIVDGI